MSSLEKASATTFDVCERSAIGKLCRALRVLRTFRSLPEISEDQEDDRQLKCSTLELSSHPLIQIHSLYGLPVRNFCSSAHSLNMRVL